MNWELRASYFNSIVSVHIGVYGVLIFELESLTYHKSSIGPNLDSVHVYIIIESFSMHMCTPETRT